MNKTKKTTIIVFALVLTIIIAFSTVINTAEKFILTIYSFPLNSQITLNGKNVGQNSFSDNLPQGEYTISISLPGYQTKTQTVSLSKPLTLDISLEKKQTFAPINTPSIKFEQNIVSNENKILAIDKKTNHLIEISPQSTSVVYKNQVTSFSYQHPLIVILNQTINNHVIILNLDTNSQQTINLAPYSPVISVSVAPDLKTLFVLGKFDPQKRQVRLFKTTLANNSPQEITITNATSVKAVSSSLAVTFSYADAENLSKISLVDTTNPENNISFTGNSYSISPSSDKIAVSRSDQIIIFDIKTRKNTTIPTPQPTNLFWINNTTLGLLQNQLPGIILFLIEANTGQNLAEPIVISDIQSVRKIIGFSSNQLYIFNQKGNIISLILP